MEIDFTIICFYIIWLLKKSDFDLNSINCPALVCTVFVYSSPSPTLYLVLLIVYQLSLSFTRCLQKWCMLLLLMMSMYVNMQTSAFNAKHLTELLLLYTHYKKLCLAEAKSKPLPQFLSHQPITAQSGKMISFYTTPTGFVQTSCKSAPIVIFILFLSWLSKIGFQRLQERSVLNKMFQIMKAASNCCETLHTHSL